MSSKKKIENQFLKVVRHYLDIENYFEAIKVLEEAYSKTENPELLFKVGLIYKEKIRNLEKALEFFTKTLQFTKLKGSLHNEIARVQISLNNIEKAKLTIEEGLKINSFHDDLIYTLSTISKPNEIFNKNLLLQALNKYPNSIRLNYAIAKYFDDLKDYEKAYPYYDKANNLQNTLDKFNHKQFEFSSNYLLDHFKKNSFPEISIKNHFNVTPIFILGMPRSGTTLVEQIISSHSKVASGGELLFMPKIYNLFLKEFYQKKEKQITGKIIYQYASQYLDLSIKQIFNLKEDYFTDKLPNNFLLIGFIKLLFPKSPIILCEREKRDICISIYKNLFTEKNLCYSNNQKDIKKYFSTYEKIINTWKKNFDFFSVKYENLVNNFDQEIKKIINYCGLELESSNIHFQKSKNPVFTLSSYQVRQPIYGSSINGYKNYIKYWTDFLS